MAAMMPAASAYMADITDVTTRTKGMGAVGAATNLGNIIGPAAGGLLAGITLLTPLWFGAGLALATAFFVFFFLPESPGTPRTGQPPAETEAAATPIQRPTSVRLSYWDPRILPYIIVGVLMFTGMAMAQQTLPFRFQDVLDLTAVETAQLFGTAMGLSALASLASQLLLMQRFDLTPFRWLLIALPVLIAAFFLMAIAETRTMLVLAMILQGGAMGLAGPGFMAGASLAVSAEEQGAVAGVAGSCGPLGFTLGPLMGGFFYQLDPSLPYWFTLVVYLPLTVFVFTKARASQSKPT